MTMTSPISDTASTEGPKAHVLLIDDDHRLLDALQLYLERASYEIVTASDGVQGLEVFAAARPDVVILDVMMPKMNGWDTLKKLREMSQVPVIMLTARGQESDRVTGLRLGADDYVAKPFSLRELEARIEAVLRRFRVSQGMLARPLYQDDHLSVDATGWDVSRNGEPVDLTATERRLLLYLVENANRSVSADSILERVWGKEYAQQAEYVKLYIWRLRQKLERDPSNPSYIVTERGHGYRFVPSEQSRTRI